MEISSINSMVKGLISNSSLQDREKHLAKHSKMKTLVKKLKQQQVPKSEIISITGHNPKTGLDAYGSGDEVQQKQLSHSIDNHQPTKSPSNSKLIASFFPNGHQFFIKTYQRATPSALIIVQLSITNY